MKEDIDAPATLLTYLRPKIRRLLEVVNSSGKASGNRWDVGNLELNYPKLANVLEITPIKLLY